LNMADSSKNVMVIGGGIAGIATALTLSGLGITVDLVEKDYFFGGHAVRFACKATDQCVKCGACMVEEKLSQAVKNPSIRLLSGCRLEEINRDQRFRADLSRKPSYIDAGKCTACGLCYRECPEGAVRRGYSASTQPFFAIDEDRCLYFRDQSCEKCREICPEKAISLEAETEALSCEADAIVMATGFDAFKPVSKPYGYGSFKNVVTSLEMEEILRENGAPVSPRDGKPVRKMAFIQCVGSRDASLGHLWCSRICCGTSLRMARMLKHRDPELDITFFYIDIQTFGRDFDEVHRAVQEEMRLVRAIPGDIYENDQGDLKVTYQDSASGESIKEDFDLVVLSVGLMPAEGTQQVAGLLKLQTADWENPFGAAVIPEGVFMAGTVAGPMGIADSVADAGRAALEVSGYLGLKAGGK
jgi:heterodisulfide reductase subunit A